MKRQLRSRSVQAALLGGAAFALAACEEPQDLSFFENVEQCRSAAGWNATIDLSDCDAAFTAASAEHAFAAPRYEDLALCEQEHGKGACGTPEQAGGVADPKPQNGVAQASTGGSSFMPFFMGYMMGNLTSGSGAGAQSIAAGRPVYRDRKGSWVGASGAKFGRLASGATVKGYASSLRSPAAAKPAAPMSRATITRSGGFGAARSASVGRSFGG
jgi:uncharacterized protein YgiB involved in biofilm formation